MPPLVMSERDMQSGVIDAANRGGWLYYHTYDSRHSVSGFPDLVLVRGRRLMFVELKSITGRVSDAQREWITALNLAGHTVWVCWAAPTARMGPDDIFYEHLIEMLMARRDDG